MQISKKICLLGNFAVGKTSLVRRFIYSVFDDKYISTIGVKVSRKKVSVPTTNGTIDLTMMLWDLAGGETIEKIQTSYYRGTEGAILVCDLTQKDTLDNLQMYVDKTHNVNPQAKFIIAANKSDLTSAYQFSEPEIEAVATQLNAPYYFTSAKTGDNVEALFRQLAKLVTT